jgi:hypothetical protein
LNQNLKYKDGQTNTKLIKHRVRQPYPILIKQKLNLKHPKKENIAKELNHQQ